MANLRAAQKELTRRLLLDSGLELFRAQGYGATTVDDIATKAGTTRVTFYAYFPSRAALMQALIDERLNESLQRIRSPEHGSTAQALVDVAASGDRAEIHAWLSDVAAKWPTITPILRIAREAAVIEAELQDLVDRWMEEAISDIEEGLTRADRLPGGVRHFRGVLAMAQLDYVAQHWGGGAWGLTQAQMLDELADSWVALLN